MKQKVSILSMMIGLIIGLLFAGACSKSQEKEKGSIKTNPFQESKETIKEGEVVYLNHCEVCHGSGGTGDICPNLRDKEWLYGSCDNDLFISIAGGRPDGMPKWGDFLDEKKIWKVITYIRSMQENKTRTSMLLCF